MTAEPERAADVLSRLGLTPPEGIDLSSPAEPFDEMEEWRAARRAGCLERLSLDVPPEYDAATAIQLKVEALPGIDRVGLDESLNGAFLHGHPGVGKTWQAVALARRLIEADRSVRFCRADVLLDGLRELVRGGRVAGAIHDLCTVDVLFIDDIGREKFSPWVGETWFKIIDTRLSYRRTTVVTSNHSLDSLARQVGAATASRLAHRMLVFELVGPDLRKAANAGEQA